MKYIISKRQYDLLVEQSMFGWSQGLTAGETTKAVDTWNKALNPHTLLTVLQIGTAFIPVAGVFISAGIGLTDAALYYSEGDKKSASLVGALSILPFIGRIPFVKKLGAKGMAALASKLSKGNKNFTQAEIEVLENLKKNESLIKNELQNASTKLTPISKEIQSLKPSFIKQFGQLEYEKNLTKFLNNQINKEEFLNLLKSAKKTGPVKGVKGLSFSVEEMNKISNLAREISKGAKPKMFLKVRNGDKVENVLVQFIKEDSNTVAYAGYSFGGQNYMRTLTFNIKNLPKSPEEIKKIIYHELTHIKDPMPDFLIQDLKTGEVALKSSGGHFSEKANKLFAQAEKIKKNTPPGKKLPQEYYDLRKKANELFDKYEYSPAEKTANFQMIYSSIPDKINFIINNYSKKFGKKKALDTLNLINDYFKGKGGNLESIFGKRQVDYINRLKTANPKEYNDLVKKIFQEVENIKSQL